MNLKLKNTNDILRVLYNKLGDKMDTYGVPYKGIINAKLFDKEEKFDWCKVSSHEFIHFFTITSKYYYYFISVVVH